MYYSGKIPFLSAPLARFLSLLPLNLDRRNQFRRLSEFLSQRDEYAKIASVASITTPTDRALLFGDELTHYSRVKREDDAVGVVRKILGTRVKGNLLEKMLFYDMFSSLSENLLLSEDKMAMAASIEARVPFLDVEFASTALTIPASLKIKRFHGKYIHKKVCEAYLPKEIVYQPKIGFNNPVEKWLKASLGEKLMDYVLSQNSISRHYLHIPYITKLYNDHKRGNADHQRLLFLLLSIEQWGQQFLPHSPGV
jgi:asparagine synthetase B (glutamine-hydrolysing)